MRSVNSKKKNYIIIVLLVVIFSATTFSIWITSDIPWSNSIDMRSENITDIKIFIADQELKLDDTTTIYSASLMPEFRFENSSELQEFSLNESLNIFTDDFYGSHLFKNNHYYFLPNFIISPKTHSLLVRINGKKYQYNFNLAYHETFNKKLFENPRWRISNSATNYWFNVRNFELHINPGEETGHSSVYYNNRGTEGDIILDISIRSLGDVMAFVPYLLNGNEYKFALGTNTRSRNTLFSKDTDSLDGDPFSFKAGERYHIRLVKDDSSIVLYAKEIGIKKINPRDELESFKIIFNIFPEQPRDKKTYYLGFSIWESSQGVIIDDIFVNTP